LASRCRTLRPSWFLLEHIKILFLADLIGNADLIVRKALYHVERFDTAQLSFDISIRYSLSFMLIIGTFAEEKIWKMACP